ncbi:unnamed protein product [Periconia digitata]|uniref:MINDY deubiquitinase domain-containing protein n=1 Tax=Periconia digitata TaxID=1303443 RepID=A0A9W4UCP0_9PLEO|nr:unnamed protein product [Periconia digitata]
MVLRKPLPADSLVPAPLSQAINRPPYPTTPSDEHPPSFPFSSPSSQPVHSQEPSEPPASNPQTAAQAQNPKKEDDDDASDYSDNEWDQSDEETPDLPDTLKIGGGKPVPIPGSSKDTALPDILRPGPPPGVAPKRSNEYITPDATGATSSSYGAVSNISAGSVPLQTNNPYLKMQHTGQSAFGGEDSQQVWGDSPAQAPTYTGPAELPSNQTPTAPTKSMQDLSLNDHPLPTQNSDYPPHPPIIAVESATAPPSASVHSASSPNNHEPGMDASSLDAFAKSYGGTESTHDQNNWNNQHAQPYHNEISRSHQVQSNPVNEPAFQQPNGNPSIFDTPVIPQSPEQPASTLPASTQETQASAIPPRPSHDGGVISAGGAGPESPNSTMDRQRKETYQIKQIRWHDVKKSGIRTSPILTQNLNGPCPLLALVNALVLSTPAHTETALVETLRTREQVTLGLLLDAVFDELMSGRRGGAAQELPDVSELYNFLLRLHTGLNVNPMFVKDADTTDGTSTLVPGLAQNAGGFENTREMKLYRTFNIPLMHGWLPDPGSDAYLAFERIAKSYDTSQYVQFQEEELDAKLQTGDALSPDEQQMFTDIHAIKEFLSLWPTQLTNHGLRTMRDNLASGQVAILFRNDHFTTLYKDPRTEKLVTLVTDQGYSSHEEIVWESLVDVNGQGSELFSGDFRPVGGDSSVNSQPTQSRDQPPVQSLLDADDNEGWTTVHHNGNQQRPSAGLSPLANQPPASPSSGLSRTEQEDHDLALALQLQEEEEDQHRRAQEERRRQENRLSENAISTQSQARPGNRRTSRSGETPPVIPPRRNAPVHRPGNEPAPPPTYEEASTAPQYHPPAGHPASQNAPLRPQGNTYQNSPQQAPPNQMPHGRPHGPPGRHGRHSGGPVGSHEDRDKCIVM